MGETANLPNSETERAQEMVDKAANRNQTQSPGSARADEMNDEKEDEG